MKVRVLGMSLRVEQVHRVDVADVETKLNRVVVELYRVGGGSVYAANIDGKFAVDEDPKVIVTGEREHLAAAVQEASMDFSCEAEIVL